MERQFTIWQFTTAPSGGEFYIRAMKHENCYETLVGPNINCTIWLIKLSPTRGKSTGFSAVDWFAMHEGLLRELHSLDVKNK